MFWALHVGIELYSGKLHLGRRHHVEEELQLAREHHCGETAFRGLAIMRKPCSFDGAIATGTDV